MVEELEIRESTPADRNAIDSLYPQAFPDEDLVPLVHDLLDAASGTVSLVGTIGADVVASIIFTKCDVEGWDGKAALLAPLAVDPGRQRQGIGSTMVRAGLQRMEQEGVARVFVLGDPAYYGRLGFMQETAVVPPYPLPPEWAAAWQSLALSDAAAPRAGKLLLPELWLKPALWLP